ncbi:gag-pol polyprotein [Tanacetum coccineum]
MVEELAVLHRTQTCDLVPFPDDKRAIGSRWVYKIKTKFDGSIKRYKDRRVAKGYAREYGMDYEETFAPIAKMTTIRTLIVVASSRKWKIFQLDVKNVFLNGDLNEEVFMTPPPDASHKPGEVCKRRKALIPCTVLKGKLMYFYTNFRSTISHGDCFIPFDIKQSFSRLVNLLEVKQHVLTSVKEIDYAQLGIVNQAELKLQPRAFFSFCTAA